MNPRDARAVVLARIQSALANAPTEPVEVPRDYDRRPFSGAGDLERFAMTVAEYRAHAIRVAGSDIAATIASLIPRGGFVATPSDVPINWTDGVDTMVDRNSAPLSIEQLDRAAAVITGCALAVAATGTIVLDAGATQGRRALTLVPDHHICVVFSDQVVDTIPQAFAALDPTRPLTLISGPSATSDIELTRVEGVHGPRTLDVLLVDGPQPGRQAKLHV